MAVRVEIKSEEVVTGRPARILVYENDKIMAEITGKIESQAGADGGRYPAVVLEQK